VSAGTTAGILAKENEKGNAQCVAFS